MKRFLILLIWVIVGRVGVIAQQPDIGNYLLQIENGRGDDVRAEITSLLNQYPNNPGVLYLQAVLTTDGAEAVRLYQDIVDKYPTSEWADDALYKVYKFYYAIGLYRTAEIKMNQLRSSYPNSAYLAAADTEARTPAEQNTDQQQATPPPVTEVPKDVVIPKADERPTPVELTPIEQKPIEQSPVEQKPAAVSPGKYSLQVGVYSTRANANKQKQFFEYQKYQSDIGSKMKGSKELFVVYVGSFATEAEAKAKGDELRRSFNIDYLVVTR